MSELFTRESAGARWAAAGVVLLTLASGSWALHALQEEPFPHDQHEGLFPLCAGCHEGVPEGDLAAFYPEEETCTRCHDGTTVDSVAWSGPSTRIDNVRFTHQVHATRMQEADDPPQTCRDCHSEPDGGRMSVAEGPRLDTCFQCHAHEAAEHYEDAECTLCHVPLAETDFPLGRIEALPEPPDHEYEAFAAGEHGVLATNGSARCATCHTSDRCAVCHVDAGLPEIQALPAAPPEMVLPAAVAVYDEPDTHTRERWFWEHGNEASAGTCGTCHTSDDCRTCHIAEQPPAISTLVPRSESTAPGVGLETRAPDSHESFFFIGVHSVLAAADQSTCATCHVETFCVECHDGPANGGYHPTGFVARHSADAFGRSADCATCHSTQVFCRACHEQTGLADFDRLGPDFHVGGPIWLIRHGQAARQNLESCASCHAQTDCTACHSAVGAFKVNPHGRDFDAERAFAQSPRTCAACHIRNPLGGSEP